MWSVEEITLLTVGCSALFLSPSDKLPDIISIGNGETSQLVRAATQIDLDVDKMHEQENCVSMTLQGNDV